MRRLLMLALIPLLIAAKAPSDAEAIKRIETYLTNLTSIVADFNQVSANGELSSGKFYLKRPGKMRWDYKKPSPMLLVSNGKVITFYDEELQQVSYMPVDDTLAGFLAQPRITLNSDSTKLTSFKAKEGVIRATLVQKSKPDEGSLTLEFSDAPLQLRQMVVTDATGQRTQIQLQNAAFGPVLPDSLFAFKDPRGINPRKKR